MRKAIFGSLLLFALAMLIGMVSKPAAFDRFFITQSPIFDAGHYLKIASSGYVEPPLAAFYPLWPMLLRWLILPLGSQHTVLIGSLFAFVLFALSLIPFAKVALRGLPFAAALCALSLYVLNPNSLFHILLYTESLTALFGSIFLLSTFRIIEWEREKKKIDFTQIRGTLATAVLSLFALSLTRPVALPLCASAAASTGCVLFFRSSRWQEFIFRNWMRVLREPLVLISLAAVLIAVLAYIPYGLHAQQQYGSFLAPFDAQKFWDRKFGLHWDILFKPKSVSSSDNVLFWDLQAFYVPFALLLLPFLARMKVLSSAFAQLGTDWLYWLCAFFAAAHAAIAFLTYPIFMSLARHVFALPFVFYCIARILALFWNVAWVRRVAWSYAGLSFMFLVYWWSRYAREGWIG